MIKIRNADRTITLEDALYMPWTKRKIIAQQKFESKSTVTTQAQGRLLIVDETTGNTLLSAVRNSSDGFHYLKQHDNPVKVFTTTRSKKRNKSEPGTDNDKTKNKKTKLQEPRARDMNPNCTTCNSVMSCPPTVEANNKVENSLYLWHNRMGHPNYKNILYANKHSRVKGLKLANKIEKFCLICSKAKQTKSKTNFFEDKPQLGPGEFLHCDIDVLNLKSKGGTKYALFFTDDYSKYTWVYCLKTREDLHIYVHKIAALIDRQYNHKLKRVRSDNEFVTNAITKYCDEQGVILEPSPAYEKNYVALAERTNRTVMDKTRALLLLPNLPSSFSAEAIKTSVYLKNRTVSKAVPNNQTPYQALTGKIPSIKHIRTFGCEATAKIQLQHNKLEERAERCILLGFNDNNTYRLLSLERPWRIINSASVRFNEQNLNAWTQRSYKADRKPQPAAASENSTHPAETKERGEQDPANNDAKSLRRSQRQSTQQGSWRTQYPYVYNISLPSGKLFEPQRYEEAIECEDSTRWKRAMQDEYDSLMENETWKLVFLPRKRRAISCRWVYKIKTVEDKIDRLKARLVAKGFMQKLGIDFFETYSPVASLETIRLVTCEAFLRGMTIDQLDIKTAYLYGEIDSEIYMRQPKGYEVKGKEDMVCLLLKSLYGLKQAGRVWNHTLVEFLKDLGYKQCMKDRCVFVKGNASGKLTIIIVYVDDLIIASNNDNQRREIKASIKKRFKMHDLGNMSYILGIKVDRTENTLHLSQAHYVTQILERFHMTQAKKASYPMQSKPHFDEHSGETKFPYRAAVGALMFLACATRPDIATAVNILARFLHCFRQSHVNHLKQVLRYLVGTRELGITFYKDNQYPLFAASDANWATEPGARSRTGYALFRGGAACVWKTTLQKAPALSTAEAEYHAACRAAQAVLWARELLNELTLTIKTPTKIQIDNQSAIKMGQSTISQNRTRHIAVKEQFVNHYYDLNEIDLEYVTTTDNSVDHFTKTLTGELYTGHTRTILGKPDNDQFTLSTKLRSKYPRSQ